MGGNVGALSSLQTTPQKDDLCSIQPLPSTSTKVEGSLQSTSSMG